jgi:hypothetical protein
VRECHRRPALSLLSRRHIRSNYGVENKYEYTSVAFCEYAVVVWQLEAFSQFFIGHYKIDMTYEDNLVVCITRNLSSFSGFWFDCVTSIPWSYMDMHFYLVLIRPLFISVILTILKHFFQQYSFFCPFSRNSCLNSSNLKVISSRNSLLPLFYPCDSCSVVPGLRK